MRAMILAVGLVALPALCYAQQVNTGTKGAINAATLACPSKGDLVTFLQALSSAAEANDTVGRTDAIQAALTAGCMPFQIGDTGLVIDWASGYREIYDRVRMDSDAVAYWLPADDISPASK